MHISEIDLLIESDDGPLAFPEPALTETDKAIAAHASAFVGDGATVQTGIGSIPSAIASLLAEGDGSGYGVHSEMFTDGLMRLHRAGKVANRKGQFDGVSVATFAMVPGPVHVAGGQRRGRVPAGRGGQRPM